jgi:hypothetical protein
MDNCPEITRNISRNARALTGTHLLQYATIDRELGKNRTNHSDPAAGITGTELLKTRGKAMLQKVTVRLTMVAMTKLVLSGTVFSAQGGAITKVGTPRALTLSIDALDGRVNNPTQMSPYLQTR